MRQSRLASEALDLKRRVFASYPLQIRLAYFALRLAVQSDAEFGRIVYAYFATQGVKDLPPIGGKTVEELGLVGLDPRKKLNVVLKKLPGTYGKAFGSKAKAIIYKDLGNKRVADPDDVIEGAMSHVMMTLLTKAPAMAGHSLKESEGYVIRMMRNWVINYLKKHSTWREQQIPETDEGEAIEFADPGSLQNFLKNIDQPRRFLKELLDVGRTENQRSMINLRLQGFTNAEISREIGVDPALVTRFFKSEEPSLRKVVQKYI